MRVVHDDGPDGWQFYDDVEPLSKPVVMEKTEMLKRDPSLRAIVDLEVGWEAERKTSQSEWTRHRIGTDGS